jgi:hypothetical protein
VEAGVYEDYVAGYAPAEVAGQEDGGVGLCLPKISKMSEHMGLILPS